VPRRLDEVIEALEHALYAEGDQLIPAATYGPPS
jgi:hypothetical protein